jgi:hypothetical protein
MNFEDAMKKIARRAERATKLAMGKLASGRIKHEDDLTPALAQAIEYEVNQYKAGGVTWDAAVLTHKRSGEEGVYGADLLIHVKLDTPQYKYSKGVLVQAKRIGPGMIMSPKPHSDLLGQCTKMMDHSAASFVFAYDPRGLRAASASKIAGAADKALYDQCSWTAYRFFLELFRCPVGDKTIKSADVADLARYGVAIKGTGDLDADRFEDAHED